MLANSPERVRILSDIRSRETEHGSARVTSEDLIWLRQNLLDLYEATYGHKVDNPLVILPPNEGSRERMGDTIAMNIPRGRFEVRPVVMRYTDTKELSGMEFRENALLIVHGNPRLIDDRNTLGVFKWVMAHEMGHEQIQSRSILGSDEYSTLPSLLGTGADIYYTLGFKAVSLKPPSFTQTEITRWLEEHTAQYIAMFMLDGFNESDPTLEKMRTTDLGINGDYIQGAEALNQIFQYCGLSPLTAEDYHFVSDIQGFADLIDQRGDRLSRRIISACIVKDRKMSAQKLQAVRRFVAG